jgi:hypothetical protein
MEAAATESRRTIDQRICGLRMLVEAMQSSDRDTREALARAGRKYLGVSVTPVALERTQATGASRVA